MQARFDDLGGYALEARAREILAGLGFSQESMDADVAQLSGGWKMRVALARILLMRPDAMLLDEPSNHLDLESLIWLENFLKGFEGALLMTSHDREFMNRIVGRVIEIDGGVLTSYSGNLEFYERQRAQNETQAQAAFERQQAMLAKEMRFIERFKAQAAKASQVQSRVKKLDKIEKVEPPKRRKALDFEFPACPRSGDDVVRIAEPAQELWRARHLRRPRPVDPAARALGGDGRQRRRQVDAAQADRGRDPRRRGQRGRSARASGWATSPSTRWSCSTPSGPSTRPWRTRSPWPTSGS